MSSRLAESVPHFSKTNERNGLVFVSGQLPILDMVLVEGDIAAQTRYCLNQIQHSLRDIGLSMSDIVKTTVWIARVEDFVDFNAAYAEAFKGLIAPARSTVRADLMIEGALVEIEAIALRPCLSREATES
ncbi:RidA family protein [Ottowia thiooxydans]|uniref:2-iminobutanoate/2-iminopropanoate deaminase n=1 Tax=Ottowia thiooxydans TaxID=219182 RepID=A0ABV2Q367_9BURK